MKIFCVLIRKRIHEWTGAEISVFLNSDNRSQPKEMAINLKTYYSALMGMVAVTGTYTDFPVCVIRSIFIRKLLHLTISSPFILINQKMYKNHSSF